jgi:hypothetical protein
MPRTMTVHPQTCRPRQCSREVTLVTRWEWSGRVGETRGDRHQMVMLITKWVTCVPSQDAAQAWVPEIGQARRVPPKVYPPH